MNKELIFYLFIFVLIISGCAQPAYVRSPVGQELSARSKKAHPANALLIKKLLYDQHREWKGVKYKDNGLSKKGVDCSGLVHLTFRDKFGRNIPRTTSRLLKSGKAISKKNLRPGDLVFFKTGFKKRHVGIYVEKKKFLHASTSRGVTISRLDNVYWKAHYWQARRL